MRSLHLVGKERVIKELIHRLSEKQQIRNGISFESITSKMFTVSVRKPNQTLRLYKGALPVLRWLDDTAHDYYMDSFWNHNLPGSISHIERNHRVAEAVCMFLKAGVEVRPYTLPELQNECHTDMIGDISAFYLSRELKKVGEGERNKTMFSRLVGALFAGGQCYAVYNTRDAVMKWRGMGEFKTIHSLLEIARLNSKVTKVDSAILFGKSEETALQTLTESDKSRRLEFRFDSVYRHIHFIPLDETGMRLIRIMCIPDWNEKLLDVLFDSQSRSFDLGAFEYDAKVGEAYVLSFLDGDVARLIRFRDAIGNQSGTFEVLCYPQQADFLKGYLGRAVSIRTIGVEMIEEALGIEDSEEGDI